MRRRVRRWLQELRQTPDERRAAHAECCMEALFDPQRAPTSPLGEHEEAAIEAERRRWSATPRRTVPD